MVEMCEYKFRNGEICKEEALLNSKYCILHIDLPEDEESEEFKRLNKLKEEKVKEKVDTGDFDFEGAKLLKVDFSNMTIKGSLDFCHGVIRNDVRFDGAEIGGDVWFAEAKIGGDAVFVDAQIGGAAWFVGTQIGRAAWFDGAEIGGAASFRITEIKGACSFKDAAFKNPKAQEEACRTARKTQEKIGDRVSADYYFYREMEAKRKQKYLKFSFSFKPILKLIRKLRLENVISNHIEFFEKERRIYRGFLELPVQYIFGYGVHPLWVIGWWLITVFSLASVYYIGNGIIIEDNLIWWKRIILSIYFSIITAATPGYGGYKPVPGCYQALASFEAIFGTFMWAAFIATFARKYMR